jgi:hypothetical protein
MNDRRGDRVKTAQFPLAGAAPMELPLLPW